MSFPFFESQAFNIYCNWVFYVFFYVILRRKCSGFSIRRFVLWLCFLLYGAQDSLFHNLFILLLLSQHLYCIFWNLNALAYEDKQTNCLLLESNFPATGSLLMLISSATVLENKYMYKEKYWTYTLLRRLSIVGLFN